MALINWISKLIITFMTTLVASLNTMFFQFNQSQCQLYVDDKVEYEGYCYNFDIYSIGSNGNSKKVILYQDEKRLNVKQEYVSDNVKVKRID